MYHILALKFDAPEHMWNSEGHWGIGKCQLVKGVDSCNIKYGSWIQYKLHCLTHAS